LKTKEEKKMKARGKAFLGIGLATLAAAAIIGGGVYVAKNSEDLLAKPRSALVHMINESDISAQDRLYLLESNAEKVDPQVGIQVFDQYIMDKLPADQRLAYVSGQIVQLSPDNAAPLIDALVQGAGVPKTLEVCQTNVFDIAGPIQQLDHLQDELTVTPTDNYGPVLGTMVQRIGTDLYTDITKLFQGGK
jgi:hypothetical protein